MTRSCGHSRVHSLSSPPRRRVRRSKSSLRVHGGERRRSVRSPRRVHEYPASCQSGCRPLTDSRDVVPRTSRSPESAAGRIPGARARLTARSVRVRGEAISTAFERGVRRSQRAPVRQRVTTCKQDVTGRLAPVSTAIRQRAVASERELCKSLAAHPVARRPQPGRRAGVHRVQRFVRCFA